MAVLAAHISCKGFSDGRLCIACVYSFWRRTIAVSAAHRENNSSQKHTLEVEIDFVLVYMHLVEIPIAAGRFRADS